MAKEPENTSTWTVFLSDEVISLIKEHLDDRIAERESCVFGSMKPVRTGTAYDNFTYACKKAELRFTLDKDSKHYYQKIR